MPADGANPILYVEELTRRPLRPRRMPVPGAVFVFRARSGRLSAPPGGYTSGELWWRNPRVVYEVDLRAHELAATVETTAGPVKVSGVWQVHDPVAVVANRVSDADALCRRRVGRIVRRTVAERGLAALAPFGMELGEGVRVSVAEAEASTGPPATSDVFELVSTLLREGSDPDDAPATAQWRRDRDLADGALAALDSPTELPRAERDAVVAAAVRRFAELVTRLGTHVPDEP